MLFYNLIFILQSLNQARNSCSELLKFYEAFI